LPLPAAGRPAGFSGIVSEQLRIEAAVTPDVMNVGDPVTLRISLSGPPSLAEAELPALGDFPELVDGFALGTDPPAVELRDGEKIFRQTVRVRREGVGQVPPIEISYFNTRTRSYQIAASRPFRITVRPTRIVTADDLVGEETAGQVRARSWDEGILHNYPSTAVLLHRESYSAGGLFGRPGVSAVFGASLLALIGAFVYARRREAASARLAAAAAPARRASPPLARLAESLRRAGEAQEPLADLQAPDGREDRGRFERVREGLAAWREYLQLRLELRPGRVSPGEVQAELERRGVEESLRGEVRELLVRQESLRFRGDMRVSTEEVGGLLRQTLEIAQRLEESLGQA
jgi:hypothetical protein